MASIKIATGIKTYDIEDQNGNVRGQIKFNPSDVNFIQRLGSMEEKLSEYLEQYDDTTDKLATIEATDSQDVNTEYNEMLANLNTLVFYDKQVKKLINDTFEDDNLSDVVFGKESCFNIYNGETFVERFIDGVLPIIKEDVKQAAKEMDKKFEKYTAHTFEK